LACRRKSGIQLVKIARLALEKFVSDGEIINRDRSEIFSQRAGAFVTLYDILEPKEFSLRDASDTPLPRMSLWSL
jgi:AMMECR1 domain-containing protein